MSKVYSFSGMFSSWNNHRRTVTLIEITLSLLTLQITDALLLKSGIRRTVKTLSLPHLRHRYGVATRSAWEMSFRHWPRDGPFIFHRYKVPSSQSESRHALFVPSCCNRLLLGKRKWRCRKDCSASKRSVCLTSFCPLESERLFSLRPWEGHAGQWS